MRQGMSSEERDASYKAQAERLPVKHVGKADEIAEAVS
jgi:hypothetical protein